MFWFSITGFPPLLSCASLHHTVIFHQPFDSVYTSKANTNTSNLREAGKKPFKPHLGIKTQVLPVAETLPQVSESKGFTSSKTKVSKLVHYPRQLNSLTILEWLNSGENNVRSFTWLKWKVERLVQRSC